MEKNPLRVLDSKEDGPKLKKAPLMKDYLSDEDKEHHAHFIELLKKSELSLGGKPKAGSWFGLLFKKRL